MLTIGERLAIIIPSIFFFLLIVIKEILDAKLAIDLQERIGLQDAGIIGRIIYPHLLLGLYYDYLLLSITNGLSIMFVLHQHEIGIIQLLIGVLVTLLGLAFRELEKERALEQKTIHERIFDFCFYLAMGQIGYLGFFDVKFHPRLNVFYSPWISFLVFFVLGYVIDRARERELQSTYFP